jgi:hypothetical protein
MTAADRLRSRADIDMCGGKGCVMEEVLRALRSRGAEHAGIASDAAGGIDTNIADGAERAGRASTDAGANRGTIAQEGDEGHFDCVTEDWLPS